MIPFAELSRSFRFSLREASLGEALNSLLTKSKWVFGAAQLNYWYPLLPAKGQQPGRAIRKATRTHTHTKKKRRKKNEKARQYGASCQFQTRIRRNSKKEGQLEHWASDGVSKYVAARDLRRERLQAFSWNIWGSSPVPFKWT